MILLFLHTAAMAHDAGSRLEEMLQEIATGEKTAMESLYWETRAAIYGFSLSITKNAADAEEVLQETYLKIWLNAAEYKAKGTPMAWILTIAKNLSLMKIREQSKYQELEADEWERTFKISDHSSSVEDRHLLETVLNLLTKEEREIILLHAVAGMKHREIADLLEIAIPTILSKYHRGLKKLKQHLESEV